jgi:Uma2 family endonuclease
MTIKDFPAKRTVVDLLPEPGEWTEADYYFISERGQLVELSDGNLEILPMPTDYHQLLALRLVVALTAFVEANKLGQVRFAPLPVRLWPGKIREPDVVFMATAHLHRIDKYWGVPDLAVEIISEGDAKRDREDKRVDYAQAGIPEYWIVDPEQKTLEILRLIPERKAYAHTANLTEQDTLTSVTFPGFQHSLANLFSPVA